MGTTVAGLEGIVAGESEICFIDGDAGVLSYRGYNIHILAETPPSRRSFICYGTAACRSGRSSSS